MTTKPKQRIQYEYATDLVVGDTLKGSQKTILAIGEPQKYTRDGLSRWLMQITYTDGTTAMFNESAAYAIHKRL